MRRIRSEKDCEYYTFMKSVLYNLGLDNKNYTWLISDIEVNPQNEEIAKLIGGEYYLILSTKELLDMLEIDDFQWIWAVFSAIPPKYSKEEILEYELPYIDSIDDDYDPFGNNPKVQHPLAEFEICVWDSSGMFIVTDNESLISKFKEKYPKSNEDFFEE